MGTNWHRKGAVAASPMYFQVKWFLKGFVHYIV
jgi:hypothetical protein